MQKLDKQTIRQELERLPGWQYRDGSLRREWQFADFKEAMRFINQVV